MMDYEKSAPEHRLTLSRARVPLVEDEYYVADDLRRALVAAGATVVGPCSTVRQAIQAVDDGGFDCAVIDLNLHGESAAPVADQLVAAGKSFAIATGYGEAAVPERLHGVPRIEKPFDPPALIKLVGQLSCANVE